MDQKQKRIDKSTEVNLCRFCLRPKRTMWPLKTLYRKDNQFLHKIYQCSKINIIDMNELYTWVCRSCRQNIEKFAAFQNMLLKNLTAFESRFREEQQLDSWDDPHNHQQQLAVNAIYDRFGDLDHDIDDEDLRSEEEQQSASSDSGHQSEDLELPDFLENIDMLPTIREKD